MSTFASVHANACQLSRRLGIDTQSMDRTLTHGRYSHLLWLNMPVCSLIPHFITLMPSVWIALAAEAPDLGMTLQHYYPARAAVDAAWHIPPEWKMTGQMPFGTKAAEPVPKTFRPDTELVRSFG